MAQSTVDNAQIERLAQTVRGSGRRRDSAQLGRLVRILRLIHLLCLKPGITSEELAEQLRISRRTLYRDIKLLRSAGIAIENKTCSRNKQLSGYHIGKKSREVLNLGNDIVSLAVLAALTRHPILNEFDPYVEMAREAIDSIMDNLSADNRIFCQSISEEFYSKELHRVIQLMAEASHSTPNR